MGGGNGRGIDIGGGPFHNEQERGSFWVFFKGGTRRWMKTNYLMLSTGIFLLCRYIASNGLFIQENNRTEFLKCGSLGSRILDNYLCKGPDIFLFVFDFTHFLPKNLIFWSSL